jgi:hypothetical protein
MVEVAVAVVAAAAGLLAAEAAHAEAREPVIVYPGRAGVPVMWFGRDISGAVIEGDWGLDRPGHGEITIIPRGPRVLYGSSGGGYFPATGQPPRYGRHEVEPPANRQLPPPAESYHREWGAQSAPTPATSPPAVEPPPIIYAPQFDGQQPRPNPRPPRPRY